MKLLKQLHEMTELEAFECLQGAASAIIKGDDLPDEVRQWVGRVVDVNYPDRRIDSA